MGKTQNITCVMMQLPASCLPLGMPEGMNYLATSFLRLWSSQWLSASELPRLCKKELAFVYRCQRGAARLRCV